MQCRLDFLGLFCLLVLAPDASAQPVTDACDYWPMCPGSAWTTTDGTRSECGVWPSLGRQGTAICHSDGARDVWRCTPGGVELLQIVDENEPCDTLLIDFVDPVPLIAEGMKPGEKVDFETGITVRCDGDTVTGVAHGTLRFIEALSDYSVPAGRFSDVLRLRINAELRAGGDTLRFDVEFYFARGVGLLREIDHLDEIDEWLLSATVCGASYPLPISTPTPSATATPTATPTASPAPTPSPDVGRCPELFRLSLEWHDNATSASDILQLFERWRP